MNSKIKILIFGLVCLVLIVGIVLLLGAGRTTKKAVTPVEEEVPGVEEPVAPEVEKPAKEKTPIEIAFEKAKDVEIKSEKGKAVDAVLRPVLKAVFDTVDEEGNLVSGVKMKEEFGSMLTYVFNRKLTETERDDILSKLEAVDVKTVDRTEKVITVQKDNQMWVITFYLNSDQKSGLEITF